MANQDYRPTSNPHNRTESQVVYEDTGLNLISDVSSRAGCFSHAVVGGYEKTSVDNYVREIEDKLRQSLLQNRALLTEIALVKQAYGSSDYTRLGARAIEILRSCEAQGNDIVMNAQIEAERIKEEGRRVATEYRAAAQTEADDIRVTALSSSRELQASTAADLQKLAEQTKAQCDAMVAAAQTHSQEMITATTRDCTAIRAAMEAEAARIIAETKQQAAAELAEARAQAVELRRQIEEETAAARQEIATMTDTTRKSTQESAEHLASITEQCNKLRQDAQQDAETMRAAAIREVESQIEASHRQASLMMERIEQQHAWQKEQLERQCNSLQRRKETVLAQLRDIRLLAEESAQAFPDADEATRQENISASIREITNSIDVDDDVQGNASGQGESAHGPADSAPRS